MSETRGLRILCLDGGDVRCMSQLYILQEMMHRVEFRTQRKTLPCQYFDLIVAVDRSSLIAVLLGLLRMTIEEAQEAFHDIHSKAFDTELSPEERASVLDATLKELLKARNISDTVTLSDDVFSGTCKVAICYSPTANMNECKMFRNYKSPQVVTQDATIIEAVRASCATPGVLSSIGLGPIGREEKVLSAMHGFNNPAPAAIKEIYHVFGPETRMSCLLSLGSGHRGVISSERGISLEAQIAMSGERVAEDLYERLGRLDVYYRFSVERGLEGYETYHGEPGSIKSHTDAYLSHKEHSLRLNHCLGVVGISVDVKIEQLYCIRPAGHSSMNGLPPLSAFFVMRKRPMEMIVSGLLERPEGTQRVMVVSGLGGSGKTQLVLRYARDFEASYRHILFVDASSAESLRRGIISRVQAIKRKDGPVTIEEALNVLADPEDACTKEWIIIMDNADDHAVDLKDYIPMCDHGSILITTRNPELGNLAPSYHLKLDVMDHDEAVEALISSIFPPQSSVGLLVRNEVALCAPTPRDLDVAAKIVKELHYLPIAVTQAGCYIKQNQCLHDYLDRLKSNRAKILKRATLVHRDKLKYPHSVYSSFDIILNALSPRAVQLLVILSFFHFSNFPRPLFPIAAKSGFKHELYNLLDRNHEFDESIQCLSDVLCPGGVWQEDELDELLEELQRYSLVSLVPTNAIVTLRFHPLVRDWARDRLTSEEQKRYQKVAIRFLVCGITEGDDCGLYEYLVSHIPPFFAEFDTLHVNDSASILRVLEWENSAYHLELWETIHQKVEAVYGRMNIRTSRAALQLANAYGEVENREKMEAMERDAIAVRELLMGKDHWETLKARSNLARTLRVNKEYADALAMETDILRMQIRTVGLTHLRTAQAMEDLARTLCSLKRHEEARSLHLGVVEIRTKVLGRTSRSTVNALELSAEYCSYTGRDIEAEELQREVLELRRITYGNQHVITVNAMRVLASQYHTQGRYKEAEKLRREELEVQRLVYGDRHRLTFEAVARLAQSCFNLGKYADAERLLREELVYRRDVYGHHDEGTLDAMFGLACSCFELKQYTDAKVLWTEELAGRRLLNGDQADTTLITIEQLGRLCLELKQYTDAKILWMEALAGRRILNGDQDDTTLTAVFWLARSCFELKQYMDAKVLWTEELASRQARYGDQDERTLDAVSWLARSYFELKQYMDAEALWIEELAGRRELHGDRDKKTLYTISWLARTCYELQRYEEAERLLREEVEIRREVCGDRDDRTLYAISGLAFLCYNSRNYEDAERFSRTHLLLMLELHGDWDERTLAWKSKLADVCWALGRYADAERLYRQSLAARGYLNEDLNEKSMIAISRLAISCHKLGKHLEEETLWREVLVGSRQLHGERDEKTLESLFYLSGSCLELKRYEETEKLRRELLSLRRELHGDGDERTLFAMSWLAHAYCGSKKYNNAKRLWRDVLTGQRKLYGDQDERILDTIFCLAVSYFGLRRWANTEKLCRELLTARGRRNYEGTRYTIFMLARSCHAQGNYNEAETLWREVLDSRQDQNGDVDVLTLDTMTWLASLCYKLRQFDKVKALWEEEVRIRRVQGDKRLLAAALTRLFELYLLQRRYHDARETVARIQGGFYNFSVLEIRDLLAAINRTLAKYKSIPPDIFPAVPPITLPGLTLGISQKNSRSIIPAEALKPKKRIGLLKFFGIKGTPPSHF